LISIDNTEIDFVFNDVNPSIFLEGGLLNFSSLFFDTFFKLSNDELFSDVFDWRRVFIDDPCTMS
jgi:hypothetical protein